MSALYKENIVPSHTFQQYGGNLTITESLDIDFAGLGSKSFADLFGQLLGAGSREDFSGLHS